MKKIIAALSTLLVVAGVKAQTTPVNKPTEPQVTTTATNTSANGYTVKLAQKATVTSKASVKVTQKETIKEALKVAPSIKKAGGK
jgi:hypothetical protein